MQCFGFNKRCGRRVSAEEGLDIGECELVVFYDAVPNAIRLIQRRGRTGRRKKGKVIMLIAEGTRDEAYMWASKKQAQKMKRLVQSLDKPGKQKLSKKDKQKGILDYIKETEKAEVVIKQTKQEEQSTKEEKKEEREQKMEKIETNVELQKKKESITIKIICDSRERNSGVIKELMNKGVDLSFERLEIGDYV
ncbi:MAG: helicase-related protein, partial [Candidatus Heimdallarchaeaceae archaeon]